MAKLISPEILQVSTLTCERIVVAVVAIVGVVVAVVGVVVGVVVVVAVL